MNKIVKLNRAFFWKTIVFRVMKAISYLLISKYLLINSAINTYETVLLYRKLTLTVLLYD